MSLPKTLVQHGLKLLLNMGLTQSWYDPCLFYGIPSTSDCPARPGDEPIIIGLYMDDFIYFATTHSIKKRFEAILSKSFILPVQSQYTCLRPPMRETW